MKTVDFTVWDAPDAGSPRLDCLRTHWTNRRLITVSVGRSAHDEHNDPPDITVASMDASAADASRQGLTLGPLLLYIDRLAEARGMSNDEATNALVQISEQPGAPITLIVDGSLVQAHQHTIPETGDWIITTLSPGIAVCVAGNHGVPIPRLSQADMTLYNEPLLKQMEDLRQTWRERDAARR